MPSSHAAGQRKFIGAVHDEWRMFSDNPDDYEIGLPIGFGATSIVYAAKYISKDGSPPYPCAIKVINLDKLPPQSLRLLRRETQLMSLSKHPNVLRVRGSWTTGHNLYIALRLMNAGSAADVMHYGWPGGMEEEVVKCILKQALEGLNYLHINGFIHRDVKAANLLIDDDGTVLLGDLGVAASLSDEEPIPTITGSGQRLNFNESSISNTPQSPTQKPKVRLGKRKSFVGTPCWMAPELISGKQYDAKADIWSFGITAIELTQGRAPRSREAPSRVLLKTVQDAPPEFARESGHHKFSKSFKEIVESCLVKDPTHRPTAAELLETSFFKSAKRKHYLVNTILKDLPPLIQRQERRPKASALTARDRTSISSWDFSIELPHMPEGMSRHSSAHPTYFSTRHSYHSHHTTIALPSPTRLDALEENAFADHFDRARAALPELASANADADIDADDEIDAEDADDSHSSVESSVFDLEDEEGEGSHPTTPELAVVSVAASSVATTPLSCSPATALDIPIQLGKSSALAPASSLEKEQQGHGKTAPVTSVAAKDQASRQKSTTTKNSQQSHTSHPPHHRRGSSPASTTMTENMTNVGSLPALKRITSASGWSSSKTSSSSASRPSTSGGGGHSTPANSPSSSPSALATPVPPSKESRWKKLMRGSNTGATGKAEDSPKKSALGRILERSGK